ncbi:G-D-S-L family lipolytic protein [uncultured Algibacter sp.]|uniref:G-D-S-L family lipolytic protein n=1 Tax=uncultured Algibacter sp. TaxID=298659 RepID=UPI003217BDFE
MKFKYICLLAFSIGLISCNDDDRILPEETILPELTSGSVDFSNYVAIGASFTAGFTDGGLFIASQENSFPNILSKEFTKVGGGNFVQPLMSDNTGGILVGGNIARSYRLTFNSETATPQPLNTFLTELGAPVPTITTEAGINIGSDFNNFGIPGAKSFHLIAPGYAGFNPYYARIASAPAATVLGDAMAKNPTFFTLSEVGGNDVLGNALSGGESDMMASNYDPITPVGNFDNALNQLIDGLTSNGAKGVITNVPNITDLPHFTTVPFKPLSPLNPAFGPQIPTLNTIFGALNGIFDAIDPSRRIEFSETEASPVVIFDETLVNISAQIKGALNNSLTFPAFVQSFGLPEAAAPLVANLLGDAYGQSRQATEDDLLVLPSSAIIGTLNQSSLQNLIAAGLPPQLAGQFSAEGITLPLEDKWVLIPSEQDEIRVATDAYNVIIKSITDTNDNIALVDLNNILGELTSTGINFDSFNLNTDLVTGGAVSLDGFHLTARGYALMANKFLEAIDDKFGTNFIVSGNVAKANDYPTNYSPLLQ